MTWAEVFDADPRHALPHRTWWWWWFIFFFRNRENPARTKQMVILWGTRNCRRLVINGHAWEHRQDDLVRSDRAIDCAGMTAGWWYDGATMHDPLFVDDGPLRTAWDGTGGRLVLGTGDRYEFDAAHEPQVVAVTRPGLDILLEIRPWTEYMSQIVPTGKRYLSHLGYQMQKIRGSKVAGSIRFGGKTERLEGTAYFQKVRINSPTSPWYWGVFHAPDGSYLDYFMPHLGPPALRRTARHDSPWDWGEWHLSNSFQFYEAATGELHKIKNVAVTKRYVDDLPVFRLEGEREGKRVLLELTTYARATWVIRQPVWGPIANVLHYNEYPANVTAFEFSDRGRRVTLDDLGPIVGNCEHSWGLV